MYQAILPPEQALGHILRHNLADERGRKALSKGHRITAADLPRLRALGIELLRVAVLEPGDIHEDEAARRLAEVVCGPGVIAQAPAASRVNLLAEADGVVRVDAERLLRINQIDGLTVATLSKSRAGARPQARGHDQDHPIRRTGGGATPGRDDWQPGRRHRRTEPATEPHNRGDLGRQHSGA